LLNPAATAVVQLFRITETQGMIRYYNSNSETSTSRVYPREFIRRNMTRAFSGTGMQWNLLFADYGGYSLFYILLMMLLSFFLFLLIAILPQIPYRMLVSLNQPKR